MDRSTFRSRREILGLLAAAGASSIPWLGGFCGCQPAPNAGPSVSSASLSSPNAKLPDGDELRDLLDEALLITCQDRRLTLKDHAAWQIVHGALAFGRDFPVEDANGKLVSTIEHLRAGGKMNGWDMEPGVELGDPPRRGLRALTAPGSTTGQGHADQWLGYLADCGLKPDETIVWAGVTYTIADIVAQVEYDVPYNGLQEYSWTLMGLTAYRPTNHTWVAADGKEWSIDQLLQIEVDHDLAQSACGGTHRMAGIVMALNRHLETDGKLEGAWKAAADKVRETVETARRFQNPDGSLSCNWFQRPGSSADFKESLGTTGHALEFVVLSVSDDELKQPWIRRAVVYVCNLLKRTSKVDLECGALYHAAHGLVVYRRRVFGDRSYLPELSSQPSSWR